MSELSRMNVFGRPATVAYMTGFTGELTDVDHANVAIVNFDDGELGFYELNEPRTLGDKEGHEFHGNQWHHEAGLAEQIARDAHVEQVDKSGKPYIEHVKRVSETVSDKARPVAWLHDVLEDTGHTRESLLTRGISPATLDSVHVLTRQPTETYREFIARIANSGDRTAVEVKLADLRDNLRAGQPSLRKRYESAINELEKVQAPRSLISRALAAARDAVDKWKLQIALAAGDAVVATDVVNDASERVRVELETALPTILETLDEPSDLRVAGDVIGHDFHGNQWTDGQGGGERETPTTVLTVKEAIPLILAGKVVELKNVHKVNTLLTKLAAITKEAVKRGDHAPNYDACKITVAGASVFCGGSLRTKEYPNGMPRIVMPQLNGVPRPGSPASKLGRDDQGRVDVGPEFMDHLMKLGIASKSESVLASHLIASQNELNGPIIAKRVAKDTYVPSSPIFISRDNYIVDGHHRWAAMVGRDASDGKLGDLHIRAIRVDAPISELLHIAKKWTVKFGLPGISANPQKRAATENDYDYT